MRKCAHSHLFCSSLQFQKYVRTVGIEKEYVDVYKVGGSKKTIKLKLFQWEKKALAYLRVSWTNNPDPILNSMESMSSVNSAVNLSREGLPSAEILNQVDYQTGGEFRRSFLAVQMSWTISMIQFRLNFSKKK